VTKIRRRSVVTLASAAFAAPAIGRADTGLPDRPLKVLVGFPAGGGSDVMARVIAEAVKQRTGRNIIIDNKAGASGTLAGEALKNSPPDGTTICYMPSATVVQKLTMPSIPFDPQVDLAPITLAGTVQTAYCVSPTIGVNTLAQYIDWLKQNPTRQNFGSTAMGSFTHFFGVMTGQAIGVPLEPVPYRGAAPLVADLQGGHVPAGCGGLTDFLEHHRAGKVKILFTSGARRATSAPDIPTGKELGYPSLQILGWYVFFAPPKTPPALIEAWGRELRAALKRPEIEKKISEFGLDVETSTPERVSQMMASDFKRWQEILDSIGFKPAQ
jgi:tripartite-type tricarboxylate transporter receptor subunit TctC